MTNQEVQQLHELLRKKLLGVRGDELALLQKAMQELKDNATEDEKA